MSQSSGKSASQTREHGQLLHRYIHRSMHVQAQLKTMWVIDPQLEFDAKAEVETKIEKIGEILDNNLVSPLIATEIRGQPATSRTWSRLLNFAFDEYQGKDSIRKLTVNTHTELLNISNLFSAIPIIEFLGRDIHGERIVVYGLTFILFDIKPVESVQEDLGFKQVPQFKVKINNTLKHKDLEKELIKISKGQRDITWQLIAEFVVEYKSLPRKIQKFKSLSGPMIDDDNKFFEFIKKHTSEYWFEIKERLDRMQPVTKYAKMEPTLTEYK